MSARDELADLLAPDPASDVVMTYWLRDHGEEVLALIDADAVIERAIARELDELSVPVVTAFFARRRAVTALTSSTPSERDSAETTS